MANNGNDVIESNIFEQLPISKARKVDIKKRCLNNIFSNLKFSEKSRSYLPVARKPSYYTQIPKRYRTDFQTYDIMTSVIDGLENMGLLESVPGFIDYSKKKGRLTKIKPTDSFKELSGGLAVNSITQLEPSELVILKKRFDNTLMEYKDDRIIKEIRNQLKKYNELRQNCKLSLKGLSTNEIQDNMDFLMLNSASLVVPDQELKLKNPFMYRVFNGSFKKGGRFYNGIESNMPKELREKILIDGEETIELDYNSFHVRILYHQIGKDFKTDAYSCLSGNCPQMRQVYKLAAMCSINALSKNTAIQAIRKQIVENGLKSTVSSIDDKGINTLLEKWEAYHSEIKQLLYSDRGVRLQNLDSKIAAGIIQIFMDAGEVLLCIHDSFIVKKSLKEMLYQAMMTEYKKHLPFAPVIS
ncbi:MAG: hypothetical protein KDC73_11115 [Ignavibacteriae bacterium]|nr:hypothetical protein [Ignavibacteriota bacterium]MCB0725240.1 hypothetical protein [Ignavibacteriota bacterium]MCB9242436.1 hypothetical protein [Ignavibacteriales bacterium]